MRQFSLTTLLLMLSGLSFAQNKVACGGNSITYGSSIENREKFNYPVQMQRMMGDDWDIRNYGVSGRTMLKKGNQPYWKEEKFTNALAFHPDVVIIKLGTNDSKDMNWEFKDEYLEDYQAMIDTFRAVSNPVFFICKPIPVFRNKWRIDSLVVQNEILPLVDSIGNKNDITVIDLFTVFEDLEELAPDGIHPNAHGAAILAGTISRHLLIEYNTILQNKLRNENK